MTTHEANARRKSNRSSRCTAGGQHYDVPRPEYLAFSGKGRLIAIGMDDDSFATLDLLLVTAIHRPIPKQPAI